MKKVFAVEAPRRGVRNYDRFAAGIRKLLEDARRRAGRSVNALLTATYWEVGRRIVRFEQAGAARAGYGEQVLTRLSADLTARLGPGFSVSRLQVVRKFYLVYQYRAEDLSSVEFVPVSGVTKKQPTMSVKSSSTSIGASIPFPQPPPGPFTLSWSHYVFLLGIGNAEERSFYEIEAAQQDWTCRELRRQFDSSLYERLALSRDKEGIRRLSREGQALSKPEDILKAPLVLEFLGLDEQSRYSESDLESAIISRIEHFLLELGKGFLFEARQKRFTFDEEHFYVDLVFYNRLLRCYVLVDLKIGKLAHQDLGQMQMYVNYFDRFVKREGENSTIGIVLCKKKAEALVEITLPRDANIHAKEYQLYLPGKEELRRKLEEWSGGLSESTTQKTTQEMTRKETLGSAEKILEAIRADPKATRERLAREVGLTADGVKYQLRRMLRKGLIRRVGPDKGGRWEIASIGPIATWPRPGERRRA